MIKKAKEKEWFTIVLPKIFGEKEIEETPSQDVNNVVGRTFEVNLMELTNDMSKYYIKFMFKVKNVEGKKAFAEFIGSECLRDYISRMVLKKSRRIDTIQNLKTKDGKMIRVKGLAIASRKMKSSIEKSVRNKISELIKNEVENSTLYEFVEKIISGDIKSKILKEGRKIYPIRNFEIRKTEVME